MGQEKLRKAFINKDYNKALNLMYNSSLLKIERMTKQLGGNKEDALDIFQESVLILIRKIKMNEFDLSKDIDAYVYVVAKRMMINKRKRDQRIELSDSFSDKEVGNDVQRHDQLKEYNFTLEDLFIKLGDKCNSLLKAIYLEELKTVEIINKLKISNTDVLKTQKNRCKKKLTSLIKDNPHIKNILFS